MLSNYKRKENLKICTVPTSSVNLKGLIKNVYPCPLKVTACPICGRDLSQYVYAVPISEKECVKITGKCCYHCDAFFSEFVKELHKIEAIRLNKSSYKLNNRFNDTSYNPECFLELRNALKSIYCQVTISAPGDIHTYTIVTNKADNNAHKDVLHYTDSLALDLLTAVVMHNKTVEIDGKQFALDSVHYTSCADNNSLHIIKPNRAVEVVIKSNGGYYDPDEDIILVSGLVFCEQSKRLEVMPVSYSKDNNMYYVDNLIYKDFIITHGWPIVEYCSHSKNEWMELNQESLIHQLGYNVNKTENLTSKKRQSILARAVDLNFTSVHSLVILLTSLIHRNGTKNVAARLKWQEDLDFIKTYKVNPVQFAFVSKIKKL